MIYNSIYEVGLNIEGQNTELTPASYSFYLEDDIHRLFSTGKLFLDDSSAFSQEYLLTMEGLNYDLSIGLKDNFITNRLAIVNDATPETEGSGTLGGLVSINLIHDFFNKQSRSSNIFNNRISRIVSDIAERYTSTFPNVDAKGFSNIIINDTGNESNWIQPLITDSDFIINYLLPFSYSNNSNNTPYYCFINSANEFNFRNYISMMESTEVATLTLSNPHSGGTNQNSVFDLKRIRKGSQYTSQFRHRKLYTFAEDDYSFEIEDDYIYSYPSGQSLLPLKANIANITDYVELFDTQTTRGDKENNLGFTINSMRGSMGLEKFIISLPINTNIRAGKTIKLQLPDITDPDQESFSMYFTGKYLVEHTKHSWDSSSSTASTIAIISRKEVVAPVGVYTLNKVMVRGS